MTALRGVRRARRLPEVLQTSTLDCGPASLTSLLRHVGLSASYEALRDLCATDVDGTSIDAMEAVAVALGVDATQMVVPVEHLLALPEEYLPAIAVTLLPDGFAHFVVLGHLGPHRIEVMDPAGGRRRLTRGALAAELYRHPAPVPAAGWREWAGSDDFTDALRHRLDAAGVAAPDVESLLEQALADPGIDGLAALDAALRHLASGGAPAAAVADPAGFIGREMTNGGRDVPDEHWSCVPGDDPDTVTLRGAVIVRARPGAPDDGDPELLARVARPDPGPWAALARAAPGLGAAAIALIVLGVVAGIAAVAEAIALRPLVEADPDSSGTLGSRAGRVALGVLAASTLAGAAVVAVALARGRRLEIALQRAWWDAVARLPEGFVRTRPASDLAERGHLLHRLRELPVHGARLALAAAVTAAAATTMVGAAPAALPAVVVLLVVVLGGSALGARRAAEADLRVRTLGGCLSRPVADALRGAATTAHRPTALALDHEHDRTLGELRTALVHHVAVTAGARGAVTVAAAGALTWALARTGADDPARLLLVLVCGLLATDAGAALVDGLRTVPTSRSVAARAAGPLAAADRSPSGADRPAPAPGVPDPTRCEGAIRFEAVSVIRGDRALLADVDLDIPPGCHVAVVGPSGAGKTTLLEVAAGLVTPSDGAVSGIPAREAVAWSTPATRLWNGALAANLTYGAVAAAPGVTDRLAHVEAGDLAASVDRRADGVIGDGGGLLSDGEAQRVRLARALGRPGARLVVLDEAFRGLERDRRRRLLDRTRWLWADATLLCALHDVADAATMDVVVVVDDGRVVEVGDPAALAADPTSRFAALLADDADDGLDGWRVRDIGTLGSPAAPSPAPGSAPPTAGRPGSVGGPGPARVAARGLAWGVVSVVAALAATGLVALVVARLGTVAYDGDPIGWARVGVGLAAAAALTSVAVAAGGRLGVVLNLTHRRRAMDRALAVDPDRARGLGVGRTLAVALDADLVGTFLVSTGPTAVLALTEIAVALLLARRSVVAGPTAAVVAAAVVATVALGAVQLGRRLVWTDSRAGLTGRLVERLVGHDTVRLQDDPDSADAEATVALAAHDRAGRRLDRAALAVAAVPAVAVVTLVALVIEGSGGEPAAAVAASLGIALLAGSGLDRVVTVVGDAVGALDAHRGVAALDGLARAPVPEPADLAVVPSTGTDEVLLAAVGITATFDGGRAGLTTPVDLVVRDGDRIVLRGASGSGKTTFGEVLAGHRRATAGRVATPAGARVVRVASVGDDHLFSASLLFNVACGAAWPPDEDLLDRVDSVVADVGLDDLVSRLPGGLSQPVGDGGWRLSAGEAARVALARALVQRPDVVVLDETTGPLDAATRDLVLAATVRHSRATVLIAHV